VTTQINSGETPTFGILVQGNGTVPFDPAANRAFVIFTDTGAVIRGKTSVAARTQQATAENLTKGLGLHAVLHTP